MRNDGTRHAVARRSDQHRPRQGREGTRRLRPRTVVRRCGRRERCHALRGCRSASTGSARRRHEHLPHRAVRAARRQRQIAGRRCTVVKVSVADSGADLRSQAVPSGRRLTRAGACAGPAPCGSARPAKEPGACGHDRSERKEQADANPKLSRCWAPGRPGSSPRAARSVPAHHRPTTRPRWRPKWPRCATSCARPSPMRMPSSGNMARAARARTGSGIPRPPAASAPMASAPTRRRRRACMRWQAWPTTTRPSPVLMPSTPTGASARSNSTRPSGRCSRRRSPELPRGAQLPVERGGGAAGVAVPARRREPARASGERRGQPHLGGDPFPQRYRGRHGARRDGGVEDHRAHAGRRALAACAGQIDAGSRTSRPVEWLVRGATTGRDTRLDGPRPWRAQRRGRRVAAWIALTTGTRRRGRNAAEVAPEQSSDGSTEGAYSCGNEPRSAARCWHSCLRAR